MKEILKNLEDIAVHKEIMSLIFFFMRMTSNHFKLFIRSYFSLLYNSKRS